MRAGLRCQLRNNRFRDLSRQIKTEERKARVRAIKVGEGAAKRGAPVVTGTLRDSIKSVVDAGGVVRLVALANYAGHVNYGTVFQAPQPFFTKGTEEVKRQLPKEYRRIKLR